MSSSRATHTPQITDERQTSCNKEARPAANDIRQLRMEFLNGSIVMKKDTCCTMETFDLWEYIYGYENEIH